MDRKRFCVGDCDFATYYASQLGKGFDDIRVFSGRPYQRGHGIGSFVRRYGIPLAKFIGKHVLNTGLAIGADIAVNDFNKEVVKQKLKEGAKYAISDGLDKIKNKLNQSGMGRKRKRKAYKVKKRTKKRKKRDIFS